MRSLVLAPPPQEGCLHPLLSRGACTPSSADVPAPPPQLTRLYSVKYSEPSAKSNSDTRRESGHNPSPTYRGATADLVCIQQSMEKRVKMSGIQRLLQTLARYYLYLPPLTHRRRPTGPRRLRSSKTLQVFVPTVSQETTHGSLPPSFPRKLAYIGTTTGWICIQQSMDKRVKMSALCALSTDEATFFDFDSASPFHQTFSTPGTSGMSWG